MVHKSVRASKKRQRLQKKSESLSVKQVTKLDEKKHSESLIVRHIEKNHLKQQILLEELGNMVRQLPEEIILEIYMYCQKPKYFFLTKKRNIPGFFKYYDRTTTCFSIIENSPRSFSFHTNGAHYFGELDNINHEQEILFLEYQSKNVYNTQIIKHCELSHKLLTI